MDDDVAVAFGRWLANELDKRDWQQSDLVDRLDVKPGVVSAWINGKRRPTYENCVKISRVLVVDPQLVIGRAGLPTTAEVNQEIAALAEIGRRVVQVVEQTRPSMEIPLDEVEVAPPPAPRFPTRWVEVPLYERFAANHIGRSGSQTRDRVLVPGEILDLAREPRVVRAWGDCLALRRILDGDILVLDAYRTDPQDGEIVAFRFHGEEGIKVCQRFPDRLEFHATLPGYPVTVVRAEEAGDLEIVGVLVRRVPQPGDDDYVP